MYDFEIGQLVRIFGDDEHGHDLSGMTARIITTDRLACDVALTCWPGVVVRILRMNLLAVDETPQSVRTWKHEHAPWRRRNAAVIERLSGRRAA